MSGFSGLDLISAAKESVGYNRRIKFAIDVATTDFYVGK
jgi:enolase